MFILYIALLDFSIEMLFLSTTADFPVILDGYFSRKHNNE
jgi:hypothetical protein